MADPIRKLNPPAESVTLLSDLTLVTHKRGVQVSVRLSPGFAVELASALFNTAATSRSGRR